MNNVLGLNRNRAVSPGLGLERTSVAPLRLRTQETGRVQSNPTTAAAAAQITSFQPQNSKPRDKLTGQEQAGKGYNVELPHCYIVVVHEEVKQRDYLEIRYFPTLSVESESYLSDDSVMGLRELYLAAPVTALATLAGFQRRAPAQPDQHLLSKLTATPPKLLLGLDLTTWANSEQLKNVARSSSTWKASELQAQTSDEEESNPALADDALDDSSSSYCTALCSLSEHSEDLEDEAYMFCDEPQCEVALSEPTLCVDALGETSWSPEITVLLPDLKSKKNTDAGESEDWSGEPICGQDGGSSSVTDPLLLESRPFQTSAEIMNQAGSNTEGAQQDSAHSPNESRKDSLLTPWDYYRHKTTAQTPPEPRLTPALPGEHHCKLYEASSSGTYTLLSETQCVSSSLKRQPHNLNLDTEASTTQLLNSSSSNSFLKTELSYFRSSETTVQTDINHAEQSDCLESRLISKIVLATSEGNQYSREVRQEQSGSKPEESPPARQQSLIEGPSRLRAEDKLEGGGLIAGPMKWEGEEQGIGVEKEQAELSLKARNRKLPASCISTLTANKQKSGIPPRCYSERILATRHQHLPPNPPVSWRWQKQSRQGVLLSSSLPPKPRGSSRQHCSTADNTKGPDSMATKLAETNTEVRRLATLDHARSSCPEASYLDVFNSSCWSSNPLPSEGVFHDWSFKLPTMSTNNHNTSVCSEASSFECIDVALENHEEVNRGAKTVPKRQIQLKRRDIAEPHANENNSSGILQVPTTPARPRDILQRQHSTPAAFHQDSHGSEPKSAQMERKQRLQKSLSLDETSSKTKMASCVITTILSKRMQQEENRRALEVCDRAFAPMKACTATGNNECLTSSANEVGTDTTKVNLATGPLLGSSQSPTRKTEPQSKVSSIKEHTSIISKTQPKLTAKHSFNPLSSGLARTEFQGSGTEITATTENEKEKLSPSKEVAQLSIQSPGQKLSCDSAKGKAWNSSAAISRAMGKQATVKTTPEECSAVQGGHKQHNIKTDPVTSVEKQEKQGENTESTPCPVMAGCLARTVGHVLSQPAQSSPVKEQESDSGKPGQSVKLGIQSQGPFKAIAPVHVVRDMRSLVKNTYNLSFRGPGEAEDSVPGFALSTPHQIGSKGEDKGKGYTQDKKPQVRKVTPPLARDKMRDLASLHTTPRGCATKATSLLESHDKAPSAGFTKVNPIIAAKANSCAASKSPEAKDSQTAVSQVHVQGSNTNAKQTDRAGMALQANKGGLTETSKNVQSVDTSKLGIEKRGDSAEHQKQNLAAPLKYGPPTASTDKLESCNPPEQACTPTKDGRQTPGAPPGSQSPAGPPSACILTVAPTPILPSYFYKPNPLGYQTISPHMGTVSYIQGPVLVPSHNQHTVASGPVPLMRSLSEEVRLLSQPCSADGNVLKQGPSKQTENGDPRPKMPSPDTQQCPAFVATLGAEVIQGTAGMLYPEVGGGLAQGPRHLLLDPETGRCFYVDMPQLPQRKMLFDPETCQYVEVLLPQQTLPGTVMPSPCAIPLPSFHIPAIYSPQCLPYIQAHPQVGQCSVRSLAQGLSLV
ncbi:hypothetical protein NFI96_003391 [Prochilodus magdalenae]|nr:hypothetical protein NFI96_003391 [Prochilodus magdalenae]